MNTYLKAFRIEPAFGKPVTVANLLTHSGGFDDRVIGISVRTPADRGPLATYLARRMPPRVMPPGGIFSYSNHGYALLGYLVEELSSLPYAVYMEERILFQYPPM